MRKKIIVSSVMFFVFVDVALIYLALTITPVTLKRNHFIYEYGETISTNPADYFNANENVLMSVKLDLSQVSDEIGVYKASGSYNNKTFEFEVEVKDTEKPKVELKKVEFDIRVNTKIYAKNIIKSVEDKSATKVYFVDEKTNELSQYKQYAVSGSYIERIVVIDAHGNQSASLRVKISVYDNIIAPEFKGVEDIIVEQYSHFNPLYEVSAIDDLEGNISERIEVEGAVDTSIPGVYKLVYSVKDKAGNVSQVTRLVSVEAL